MPEHKTSSNIYVKSDGYRWLHVEYETVDILFGKKVDQLQAP